MCIITKVHSESMKIEGEKKFLTRKNLPFRWACSYKKKTFPLDERVFQKCNFTGDKKIFQKHSQRVVINSINRIEAVQCCPFYNIDKDIDSVCIFKTSLNHGYVGWLMSV